MGKSILSHALQEKLQAAHAQIAAHYAAVPQPVLLAAGVVVALLCIITGSLLLAPTNKPARGAFGSPVQSASPTPRATSPAPARAASPLPRKAAAAAGLVSPRRVTRASSQQH